jgi:tetratricopeptide (TPR) repeat protein
LNKRHWLNLAEYVSLAGLGVGSIASFLSTLSVQVLYTSAPLSFLVLLNLANRRRLEQLSEQKTDIAFSALDRRLTQRLQIVQEQMLALPTVEAMSSMRRSIMTKNQEVFEKLSNNITNLQQELHPRLTALEEQNLGLIRPEIRQIREQYGHLFDSFAQISAQVQRLSGLHRVEELDEAFSQLQSEVTQLHHHLQDLSAQTKPNLVSMQNQINHVNRQLQKLPPPIDASSLKQEVGELIRVVADLVPRRDLVPLVGRISEIQRQQETLQHSIGAIESAAIGFKQQLSQFPTDLTNLNSTEQSRGSLTYDVKTTSTYLEVQTLVAAYLEHLRSHLTGLQEQTQTLAQQQQQIRNQVSQLPQTLDVIALQRQMQDLTNGMVTSDRALQTQIREVLEREFREMNDRLQSIALAPQYEFIVDVESISSHSNSSNFGNSPNFGNCPGSRAVLEAALEQTQERLILIYPWSNQCPLDHALMQRLETFLRRNKQLDLGWCHQADSNADRLLSPIDRGWDMPKSTLQNTLNQLLLLKRRYPDRFRFKVLGTAENFLVSDHSFAVLGIHGTLTTNTVLEEMQLKLRTNDSNIVEQLIQRFEHPVLDPGNRAAYWNRAVTRDDLGDKAGAIADYTQILTLDPAYATTYNYRGRARYDLGDRAGAIADFDKSIQLNPNQVAAFCNRGFMRAEAEDFLGAIANYSQAIQHRPEAIVYFYRGLAYQKLENYQAAEMDYSAAIRLEPTAAVAHYYRGITYQKLARHAEAIADLETATQGFIERGHKTNAQRAIRARKQSVHQNAASLPLEQQESGFPLSVSCPRERGSFAIASSL